MLGSGWRPAERAGVVEASFLHRSAARKPFLQAVLGGSAPCPFPASAWEPPCTCQSPLFLEGCSRVSPQSPFDAMLPPLSGPGPLSSSPCTAFWIRGVDPRPRHTPSSSSSPPVTVHHGNPSWSPHPWHSNSRIAWGPETTPPPSALLRAATWLDAGI